MATLALARQFPTRSITRAQAQPALRHWLWHQRSIGALLGLVGVTISTLVAVLVASLIGPFIMFVLPFILLMGFAMGPLLAMVRGDL